MLRAKRSVLLVPAVAILSLTGGCGGGKQQVTSAELVQKADQACQEEQSRFTEIQATPPANASEAADQTKALVQAAQDASSAMDDLEAPDELQAQYGSYLDARAEAIDLMKKGQEAAEDQDSRGYGAAQGAVTKSAPQRKKLANSLGFKVCSRNAGAA